MTLDLMIAGYPALRLLARGGRSRVWLAPDDLVLKVLARALGESQPGLEAEALHRSRSEHVVELVDVSASADEVVLVFPRLPRGSLADVLIARQGLDAGEAVTILAPIAATLARMHEAGAAHGAVSPDHVLFRADGAPVLIGFGSATVFEPGLPEVAREQVPGVIADRQALAALADAVLSRVNGTRAEAAAAFAETLRAASLIDLEARLGRELFELAAARPVVFAEPDAGESAAVRAVAIQAVGEPDITPPAVGLLAQLLESGPVAVARGAVRGVWRSWPPTRRRLTVGLGVGAVVVVVAVAAVPGPTTPSAALPVAETAVPAPTVDEVPVAVTAEDPLDALAQLLRRREECLRDLSVLCLDDVDQQGSAAWDDDRQTLDSVLNDGASAPVVSPIGAVLTERLGDSVLIALGPDSDPASVLLMKDEAGWRIRDYLQN